MEVTIQSDKNVDITVAPQSAIEIQVVPVASQTIQIDRGIAGPQGPAGPNAIGGYPISIDNPQEYDALMFKAEEWTNIPQEEISDGGNF